MNGGRSCTFHSREKHKQIHIHMQIFVVGEEIIQKKAQFHFNTCWNHSELNIRTSTHKYQSLSNNPVQ